MIGEYIFDIHLHIRYEHVISMLHVGLYAWTPSLGIYDHLWTLLENACNKLDLQLAEGGKDGSA